MSRFNGSNYLAWKLKMCAILIENGCAIALKGKENHLKEMKDEVFDERDELATANIYLAPDEFMLLAEESCRKTNNGGSSSDAFMARSRFRYRDDGSKDQDGSDIRGKNVPRFHGGVRGSRRVSSPVLEEKVLATLHVDASQLLARRSSGSSLRTRLPRLDSLLSNSSSVSMVVGKWYFPFVFIKELDGKLKEQTEKSVFYEMTLEQRWDRIFECDNIGTDMKVVSSSRGDQEEDQAERLLGLSILLTERMRWEQERVGCLVDESERRVNVKRTEEFDGRDISKWNKFGCYVLVERFVLKIADGTILLTHDFKHISQISSIWGVLLGHIYLYTHIRVL
ncbi:hypothetical protein TorRG33x02_194930 [Trema orientale]|uniref:Uncharacterized protein n=1 Tax=Trema orientale TaxID=63057 RepID=A0A2P5EGJ7_TREOI|nr:hypothetical protein TorRG33x02_194930 [Trema orientale]